MDKVTSLGLGIDSVIVRFVFLSPIVPRTIYVNTRVPNNAFSDNGRRVDRLLPRGRPCLNLYEITMEETDFQDNSKELASFLNHSEVEGVYETQVPLLFRLMMEVGCVCRVERNAGESRVKNEFALSQLQYKTTTECPYLTNVNVQKFYLYQSQLDTRGIFGVFLEGNSEVLLVVLTPRGSAVERLNAENVWKTIEKEINDGREQNGETLMERKTLKFKRREVNTIKEAYGELKAHFSHYKQTNPNPTIILAQTSVDLPTLYAAIPSLKTDYPIITVPSHQIDNDYPALQWYQPALKRMFHRYCMMDEWWEEQINVCRYAHIPIGNLETDVQGFIADMFYARALR